MIDIETDFDMGIYIERDSIFKLNFRDLSGLS